MNCRGVVRRWKGLKGGVIKDVIKHFIALNPETANHNQHLPPTLKPLGHAILEQLLLQIPLVDPRPLVIHPVEVQRSYMKLTTH